MLEVEKLKIEIPKKKGNLSAIARAFKVSRQAVQQFVKNHEELQGLVADARETIIDEAEDGLGKAVKKGEAWAVCFTLKTIGKDRGYTEKTEIENSGTIHHNVSGEVIHTIEEIYGDSKPGDN